MLPQHSRVGEGHALKISKYPLLSLEDHKWEDQPQWHQEHVCRGSTGKGEGSSSAQIRGKTPSSKDFSQTVQKWAISLVGTWPMRYCWSDDLPALPPKPLGCCERKPGDIASVWPTHQTPQPKEFRRQHQEPSLFRDQDESSSDATTRQH